MPWWATLYLILWVGVSFLADADEEPDGQSRTYRLISTVQHAILSVLFAGFWLHPIYHALGIAAPILFVLCVIADLYQSPIELRKIWQDEEFSTAERVSATILAPLFGLPLYIVAGIGVFTFRANGS